jgi:hypothetical protein
MVVIGETDFFDFNTRYYVTPALMPRTYAVMCNALHSSLSDDWREINGVYHSADTKETNLASARTALQRIADGDLLGLGEEYGQTSLELSLTDTTHTYDTLYFQVDYHFSNEAGTPPTEAKVASSRQIAALLLELLEDVPDVYTPDTLPTDPVCLCISLCEQNNGVTDPNDKVSGYDGPTSFRELRSVVILSASEPVLKQLNELGDFARLLA